MSNAWTFREDQLLKQYADSKTAKELAAIIGRSKNGVHHRAGKLGINLTKQGENHWNAKLSDLQVQMLDVLYEAGFSVNEIQKAAFNHVSVATVNDAAVARTRKVR